MQGIATLLNHRFERQKPPPKYQWQELALTIIKGIPNASSKKSSVFNACKTDPHLAQLAYNDCRELDKLYILYFLKVFNSLRQKV